MAYCSVWLKPVFVDIDINNLNLNIELSFKITKTKAIMCVHILGLSTNMDKLRKYVSEKFNSI